MENSRTLKLGNFTTAVEEAEVQEILVAVSEKVADGQCLLIIETTKSTLELESSVAGTIEQIHIEIGQTVNQDTSLFTFNVEQALNTDKSISSSHENIRSANGQDLSADLVVIGAGPAGYAAAFRAADLGMETILIDKNASLGGTCLNSGCIPSKFLLHIVSVMNEVSELNKFGVKYDDPYIDLKRMMQAKDNTIKKLNTGLDSLAQQRNVKLICGKAEFESANTICIKEKKSECKVKFNKAIIATGSKPRRLKEIDVEDSRIKYSEQALNIQYIPDQLLVIGGGVIGLELSSVYQGLGSKVTVIEAASTFLSAIDEDMVSPLLNKYEKRFQCLMTNTVLEDLNIGSSALTVRLKQANNHITTEFDSILIVTGRKPATKELNLAAAGIESDKIGYISVNDEFETSTKNVYAIGDVVGNPMLAHKGSHEGRKVAEICAGQKIHRNNNIPFVVYTEPEIAWVGLNEQQVKAQRSDYKVIKLPWSANGRALTQGASHGLTKLIIDESTKTLIGGGMVGPNAGEMISELSLAIGHNITLPQLASLVHPHPTLSETIGVCAEMYLKEAVEVMNSG